ncbi:MAG: hypothetical protein O3C40_25375 [Planctomycetota bacterium]|nr:hypothetical protein [Planctomycetota bacterium]
MLKTVFQFFVMGLTVLVAANSSQAASFEYLYGQLRPTAEAAPISAIEPSAWVEESDDQVALASFFDRISGGKGGDGKDDGGKDGDGKGKGCGDECVGNWRDNTEVWIGADAYKSFGDQTTSPLPTTFTNSFGAVGGFNTGLALGDLRMRAQVGASYGAYDWKGRTQIPVAKSDSLEQQAYVTMGLYKRSDVCCGERISWGVVYDQFFGHQWGWRGNEVYLSQIRGMAGYAINECNEVGVWGTFHTTHDSVSVNVIGPLATVRAMNQANAYWKHNWAFGANSTIYMGAFDQADIASWQFGMLNTAPLSHSVSLYGNFNYVVPGSATGLVGAREEQWNASVGLVYYMGAKAVNSTVSGNKGLALLPVANNGSLLITN